MKTGIIGWRGMVGSVLIERMQAENDFAHIEPTFFTTSQAGQSAPNFGQKETTLIDATHIDALKEMDVILTCQGGSYTESIHPQLRATGWNGYWIDAASTLRMADSATIILDPVNQPVIKTALDCGQKDFIGGNCTVSLMLMAVGALFKARHVEWISSMTYQAASGAGARNMRELLNQMGALQQCTATELSDPAAAILDIDRNVSTALQGNHLPTSEFGVPSPAPSFHGSTASSKTVKHAKSGKASPKPIKFSKAIRSYPSTASVYASAPCALTPKPSPSN